MKDIVLPMDLWDIGCLEEYGWSHSFRVVPGALPWRSLPSTICFLRGVVVWPGLDRRTYCCTYFAPNRHLSGGWSSGVEVAISCDTFQFWDQKGLLIDDVA